ncbi:MAG: hypothetical protein ACR2HM_10370 [Acidimicrobiales bacterium]
MGAGAGHERLYRALTVLYPRGFRADYGEPMAQLFADSVRDVGAKAWMRALPDLVRTVPNERIEAVMSRFGSSGRVLALAFAVLGAVAISAGTGGGAVPFLALAVVAVLVHQRRLFASLAGERAPLRHALAQSWWAPVAGLLGLAMVLAGVGTVFEAHNLSGRIVGSTLLMAFGAGMILGLARRPFDRTAGNALILLTTVPAMAFWWLIVPAVAAVTVWVGVLAAGFDEPAVA